MVLAASTMSFRNSTTAMSEAPSVSVVLSTIAPIETHMMMSWFGIPGTPVKFPCFIRARSWRNLFSCCLFDTQFSSRSSPGTEWLNRLHSAVSGQVSPPQAIKFSTEFLSSIRDDYRRDVIAGIRWDQTGKRGDILSYSEILIKCRLLNWMPNRRVMETIVSPLDLHPG